MSELIVREANDEDGPALKALATAVLSDYPGLAPEASGQPSLDRPAESFEAQGGRLWVVIRDEEVVGALGVWRRVEGEELELALVGLDKDTRGQGLATALLAGADAFAAASGHKRLGMWIDTRLAEAIGFLERHGFVREPGLKGRQDGSDATEIRFIRTVEGKLEAATPQPSEAPQDAGA